ncbi:MAG: hypothetical protein CSB47_09945 [Proteobacteria bacterium]|nr:MAG: hypothetical protein CSB47_09945 [Pseudomonadota bacterium]
MKTYNDDFAYSDFTSGGIEKRGVEALARALSMRRMIAFTASGITMEYGRPAWADLVNAYIHHVEKNYDRLKSLRGNTNSRSVVISPEFDSAWEEFVSLFMRLRYRPDGPDFEEGKRTSRYQALEDARGKDRSYVDIPQSLRDRPEFITTFLSICEDLATFVLPDDEKTQAELLGELRENIADQFSKTDLIDFYHATLDGLDQQSEGSKKKQYWRQILKRLGEPAPKPKSSTAELKELVGKALEKRYSQYYQRVSYDSSKVSRVNSNARIAILCHRLAQELAENDGVDAAFDYESLLEGLFRKHLDPLAVMYDDLEIRRFLTLNYDIEIERMLATRYANHQDTGHREFLDFLQQPVNKNSVKQSKHDLSNGLKRAVRSSTIGEGNLGDLFTFGAFPGNFDALVFHLHGRVDDPDNMVITQLDYERLYLSSTNLRRSFEEARHAVFNGSDILFVGTGFNESDVIAPLRDFTARHRQMDDVSGCVYALLLSSTSKRFKGENIGLSHTLYKNYGVYTIFVDGGDNPRHKQLRKDRYYLDLLLEVLKVEDGATECVIKDDQRLADFVSRIKRHQIRERTNLSSDVARLASREINVAFEVLDAVAKKSLSRAKLSECKVSTLEEISIPIFQVRILRRIILALHSRIRSRALEESLQELAKKRVDWWQNWKIRPAYRIAHYGELTKRATAPLLWVRQRAAYIYPDDELKNYLDYKYSGNTSKLSYFGHYLNELANLEADEAASGVRIKRAVTPKCGGKGSIACFLSERFSPDERNQKDYYPYPFGYIFQNERGIKDYVEYDGGFFAHLTFTLEFTSTIFALVRFITKVTETKRAELLPDVIGSNEPDRNTGLWLLKLALSELEKTDSKVFICLSGLCRLVDENGDAYNPVHREFFRILTGKGTENPEHEDDKKPNCVDLLLIAVEQKFPIRYLSREQLQTADECVPKVVQDNESQYKFRKDKKIWLKHWGRLPRASIEQSLDMAITVAERHFESFLKDDDMRLAVRKLVYNNLKKNAGGKRWGDLIDFIKSRVVYIQIVVRLLYWFTIVHDDERRRDLRNNTREFSDHLSELLGHLAIVVGQGAERDLMKQSIIEYRRLDQDCLSKKAACSLKSTTDDALKVKVETLDVIMRHLALFSYPVQPCVLMSCPDLVSRLTPDSLVDNDRGRVESSELVQLALDMLVRRGLVIRVKSCRGDDKEKMRCLYILHRDAVEVITRDMNYITQYGVSEAPYQSTFYCAQVQSRRGVPNVEHFNFVSKLLQYSLSQNRLFTGRNTDLVNSKQDFEVSVDGFYKASAVIRGAYAILRGSFSIGAVSRLGKLGKFHKKQPYEAYRSWIQDILNCAVGLTEYRERVRQAQGVDTDAFSIEQFEIGFNQPFYQEEISWLYNEYAVVSFMQGRLFDANVLYNQALRALSAIEHGDEDQAVGAPRRRVTINLALTEIELGNIRDARLLLDQIIGELVVTPYGTTSVSLLYAKGYRALCDHLTGNFSQAEKGYRSVIDAVLERRQLRAASIFKRHLADLLRVQGKVDDAKHYLLLSETTANQSQQEDIFHYTLIARARLMRDIKARSEALKILRQTEGYAKNMGLQKMLAETLKVRAEVMLAEGEVVQAGKVAA